MHYHSLRVLLIAAGIIELTACSGPQPQTVTGRTAILPQRRLIARVREAVTGDQTKVPADADVIVMDSSTVATARVGDVIAIELPMQSGTGYAWHCIDAAKASQFVSATFDAKAGKGVEQPIDGSRLGGTVNCLFEFKAVGEGRATLTFDLVRAWEKDAVPADRRLLTLEVIAANPAGN
jgi:predicted secreted protein